MAKAKREKKGTTRKGTSSDRDVAVQLVDAVELLHEHVSAALCAEVFADVRTAERERKWSLYSLSRFWLSVILEAPPSLSNLLERMRNGEPEGFLPHVSASAESFFTKCKRLSPVFFAQLMARFVEEVLPKAPRVYARDVAYLRERFTGVVVIDGSRLDKMLHRLKILRPEKAVVLPGCILAIYDLFRGFARSVWFDDDAAASEFQRAELALQSLPEGTLVLGDRLYSSGPELFRILNGVGSFGVFRRSKGLPFRKVRTLSFQRTKNGYLEDDLVEVGKAGKEIQLRLVRLRKGRTTYECLTNVLDTTRLTAQDVVDLYPLRWTVERLFFDLKVVLNLHSFYAANPNAIAMQVFAGAMVHAAFRIAQAQVARKAKVAPEEISTPKLFPLLAYVSIRLIEAEWYFDKTCEANPGVVLRKPSFRGMPGSVVSLRHLLRQRRNGSRKKRRYDKRRATWKSLKHVRGGRKLS